MRIMFITDSHCKVRGPEKRVDIYSLSILRKFLETVRVANHIKADAIIHGGDIFDMPRVTPDYVGQLAEIIKTSNMPWYIVPGNHDVYGHNSSTLSQTMLGLLAKTGVVDILDRKSPVRLEDDKYNFTVSLQGQEYYQEIDTGNLSDYDVELDSTCAYHILAAHGMLIDKPFIPGVHHTVLNEVKTNADVILAGHYHPGFPVTKIGKTTFINPGSMSRVSASIDNDRIPQYVILDIKNTGISYILRDFTTAAPAIDVLDFSSKAQQKATQRNINQFKTLLQNTTILQANDMQKILNDIEADPSNDVDKQMVNDCLLTLGTVQQSKDDSVPKLDGYKSSKDRVYITRIEAENFMCYKKLDINLDPGLNIIRGESNSGKTTLLRLIRWVQYGEPRGSDFISHWGSSVTARVSYSNGYTIERSRTKSSSGGVRILDINNTEVGSFKGTKDNPVDILNISQMPPIYITKDEKRNIAFADQLESSFLVTDSPGMRASTIGRLTGLQDVDAAIRYLNTENKSLNKEIKIKEKILTSDTNDLLKYKDVGQKLNKIKALEILINKMEEITKSKDELILMKNTITNGRQEIKTLENKLNSSSSLPPIEIFNELENITNEIYKLNKTKSTLLNVKNEYTRTIGELSILKSIPKMDPHFRKLEELVNDIYRMTNLSSKISTTKTSKVLAIKDLENTKKQIDAIDKEIEHLLGSDSCLCPVCNQVMSKENILGG